MVSKTLPLLLLIFYVKNVVLQNNVIDKFSVVSTSQKPSEFEDNINDRFSRKELHLEMRDALSALKESIAHLQKTKHEIISDVENALQNKFKIYEAELKDQLSKTKKEIIDETETVKQQLTVTKNEMVDQMTGLEKSTRSVISENKNLISEIKSDIKNLSDEIKAKFGDFEDIKKQLISSNETEQKIKKQLTETKDEIIVQISELRASGVTICSEVKKNLTETVNEVVGQMKVLREGTEKVLFKTEKEMTEMQSNMHTHFNEIKNEISIIGDFNETKHRVIRKQEEILTEVKKCKNLPTDCSEVQKRGYSTSGIYRIQPMIALQDFLVWCDMSTRGGGWTYVLNRFDGSQNFYRNWTDYKQGFGNLSGEHWLGLEHLYELTNNKHTNLLFELVDWDSKTVHALYDNFKIGGTLENYRIKNLGSYSGDAGDSFRSHYNAKFGTVDNQSSGDCARFFEGGWWYEKCYQVHLTGKYNRIIGKNYHRKSAINWNTFHGYNYSLKEVRMMIRHPVVNIH